MILVNGLRKSEVRANNIEVKSFAEGITIQLDSNCIKSKMVTTLQKDENSFGNLETKYYTPDKVTITEVRDVLFKWINILGKL